MLVNIGDLVKTIRPVSSLNYYVCIHASSFILFLPAYIGQTKIHMLVNIGNLVKTIRPYTSLG